MRLVFLLFLIYLIELIDGGRMTKKRRLNQHEKRLRKKQADENRLRKEGKSEEEIQNYILNKYYDESNGIIPGKRRSEKRQKAIKATKNGERTVNKLKDILTKNDSIKHRKRVESKSTKKGGSKLSGESVTTLTSSINVFMKDNNLKTISEITDEVLMKEIEKTETLYNDGVFTAATKLNKLLSGLKHLQVNADKEQFEENKIGLTTDIQKFRDIKNEKGIFRSTNTSSYLKPTDDEMNQMYEQLESSLENCKNINEKEQIKTTIDVLKTEQFIGSRGRATMGLETSDVHFVDDKVRILLYRGKGDRTGYVEYDEPHVVEHMKEMVEKAENKGQEKLFQMRKSNGTLLSLDSSNNKVSKLIGKNTHVTREIEVSPTRSNSVMKRSGDEALQTVVVARLTQHSARKYCAENIYNRELRRLSGMTKAERSEYKTNRIKELNDLEAEGLRLLKEKAERNNVKDIEKRIAEGPKTQKYYDALLERDFNGNTRQNALEHLKDEHFARYVASVHLCHNRIDVIASYVYFKK